MDGSDATLCERLKAMQEQLQRGRDALFQLQYLDSLQESPTVRLAVELSGVAADATYQAQGILGTMMDVFGCARGA